MTKPRKKHPYYNFDKLYSYNGTFNFLVGGRGLGKTYGAKLKVLRNFFRHGEQFIYLRRYKTELKAKNTFFADIEHEFPDWDFRAFGTEAQCAPHSTRDDKKRPWVCMGYFVSLSTSQTQKSIAFPRVTTIIFDEFIIEKGALHYLPDETDIMTNFYSTVDRYQDKTKVIFCANSVSIMNPYFMKYKIRPDVDGKEWVVMENGFIVCHFPDSKDFNRSVYDTAFGRFIEGTEYADYAVGNTFQDNHVSMVDIKDGRARYIYTLETKSGTFSVWHNLYLNEFFVQSKRPKSEMVFTLEASKMGDKKVLMGVNDKPLQALRSAFRTARVSFDGQETRNSFIDIFKR